MSQYCQGKSLARIPQHHDPFGPGRQQSLVLLDRIIYTTDGIESKNASDVSQSRTVSSTGASNSFHFPAAVTTVATTSQTVTTTSQTSLTLTSIPLPPGTSPLGPSPTSLTTTSPTLSSAQRKGGGMVELATLLIHVCLLFLL